MTTALRETLIGLIVVLICLAVAWLIGAAVVLWVMHVAQGMVK